jgi:hypothetical protein
MNTKEDNSFQIFIVSFLGIMVLFFSFLLYQIIDPRDKYEQRIIITFCDNREPLNLYFVSKNIINVHNVLTSYKHRTGSGSHARTTTYSITPTLEFYDYYRNEHMKFINVCDITEFQIPKKII